MPQNMFASSWATVDHVKSTQKQEDKQSKVPSQRSRRSAWREDDVQSQKGRERQKGRVRQKTRRVFCSGGTTFTDALKAMVARQLFTLHAALAIWRVTIVAGQIYWLLVLMYLMLLGETALVLIKRRGKEWNW